MANEIRKLLDAWANFTLTMLNLANGSAQQGTMVANTSLRPNALVYFRYRLGASVVGVAGTTVVVYLLRRTDTGGQADDGAGDATAAITLVNADVLRPLKIRSGAVANVTNEERLQDTMFLGDLGTQFTIAVQNNTGQNANNGAEANFLKRYALKLPEIQ